MLTPDDIAGLRELIAAIYGPVTEELLRDLCRCIAEAGQVTSSDAYKLLLAQSLAGADDVISDTLRRQTDLTDDAVEQLMQWAAEKTAPLEDDESLQNITEAYVAVTRKEVANALGELAAADVDGKVYPIKDVYRRTMDYVFRQVSSGAKTPEEAVRRATLRLWQRGIRTIDRSDGRSFSVEYMAQRAIMGKMGEMTTAINEKHHDDGGYDGWEISAHSACAPDHEPIQGRQYSDKDYKLLNSRLQRRIGTLSCKHIAWPIKLGVDSPQWSEEQLAAMAKEHAEGITYEGRHYTQYEATQQQKALENSIRQCKDHIAAAEEEGQMGSGELRSIPLYFDYYKHKPDKLGRCVVLSEFGGYTLPIDGHAWPGKPFGYKKFDSQEKFRRALTLLYDGQIRPACMSGLAAAIYTQLTDVENELNGLITYDRRVIKLSPADIKRITAMPAVK